MSSGKGEDWLEELGDLVPADPPEPWGDATPSPSSQGLTDEQKAFLDSLADTPPIARLRDFTPEAEGDDSDGGPPPG